MNVLDGSFLFIGLLWITYSVIGLLFPRALYSAKIEQALDRLGTKKWYRIHQPINYCLVGLDFIAASFLPENIRYYIFAGLFVLILLSVALCNKKCLGMAIG